MLMHNLVKDCISVSEISRLLCSRSYVVADRLGLKGKKKGLVVKLASQTSLRIRPIACLPLMRKLLTVIRAEKLY